MIADTASLGAPLAFQGREKKYESAKTNPLNADKSRHFPQPCILRRSIFLTMNLRNEPIHARCYLSMNPATKWKNKPTKRKKSGLIRYFFALRSNYSTTT
jgi:hypothetical protein